MSTVSIIVIHPIFLIVLKIYSRIHRSALFHKVKNAEYCGKKKNKEREAQHYQPFPSCTMEECYVLTKKKKKVDPPKLPKPEIGIGTGIFFSHCSFLAHPNSSPFDFSS